MKFRLFLTLLVTFSLFTCSKQNYLVEPQEERPSTSRLESIPNDVLVVLKSRYCANFDCEGYFKKQGQEVIVYPMDYLFMRGIRTYLIIDHIDADHNKVHGEMRENGTTRPIEIQL